jgi:AraC-like DNA-binding protein
MRPDEKIWPATKPSALVHALSAEGVIPADDLLGGTQLTVSQLALADTRVSLNQIIEICRNGLRLSRGPLIGFRAGQRFHVSSCGVFGFALLCSTDIRQAMRFTQRYHPLATPLCEIAYSEECGRAGWMIDPIAHPAVDGPLYRFLLELQFGIHTTVNRDIMGSPFTPLEFHVRYEPQEDVAVYREVFGCEVRFQQPRNRMIWDSAWMDQRPENGNEAAFATVSKLCDKMLEELHQRTGVAGKVRQTLTSHLRRETGLDQVAHTLNLTERTLRRKLREERTSFRQLLDELKMQVAIKHLRDTAMTVEEIASLVGFADTAAFRRAFRRWTYRSPHDFKNLATN